MKKTVPTQQETMYVGPPTPVIDKLSYSENTVWLNKARTYGFRQIPQDIWEFNIGGYQVCEKWLKDRKGRHLTSEDINHYQRILVAISETIRLMGEIDDAIEQYGGWPAAFRTGAE